LITASLVMPRRHVSKCSKKVIMPASDANAQSELMATFFYLVLTRAVYYVTMKSFSVAIAVLVQPLTSLEELCQMFWGSSMSKVKMIW
jgi:hypothetical protein